MLIGPKSDGPSVDAEWSALKDAVNRFEAAWRQGLTPPIEDFLPAESPLRRRVLVELVHIDLELRLKAGQPVRIEEYLARFPELSADAAVVVDLIAAEFEMRRRGEPGVTFDQLIKRFPQYRDRLAAENDRPTVSGPVTPRSRADRTDEVAPEVSGYDLLERLGRGGMGVVYKARQKSLDRLVALKFLPKVCSHDPVWLDRFHREAATASALNHPNICTIYDTGESGGRHFICMELIDGRTLDALIRAPTGMEEMVRLFRQAASAVAAAHAAGVVHRDIKPHNMMVRADGIVKVLDFGLARRLGATGAASPAAAEHETDLGTRIGTVLYMSPEQASAEPADTASDVFSLGVVLYELTTGRHPFQMDSEVGTLNAIASHEAAPPSRLNLEIPADLDGLVQRMLAKTPNLRPTAAEVATALGQMWRRGFSAASSAATYPGKRLTVGREQEIAALRSGFAAAAAGRGSLISVAGEPGIGKTTLVDGFLGDAVATDANCQIAHGHCSERLAGSEAYLPVIDALGNLLRNDVTGAVAQLMKAVSPTWYAQVAPAAKVASTLDPAAESWAPSQQAMLREFTNLFQELSRRGPVVLFLDDIHWADDSTIDLLRYLGRQLSALRVLVVVTYRPTELLLGPHPFHRLKLELQVQGVGVDLHLSLLGRNDIDHYLSLAFPGHAFPWDFANLVYHRTEGSPLFMVDLMRYLRERGVIARSGLSWLLARELPNLLQELPESVRSMVQRELERLGDADRRLLAAASVQGNEFDSAVLAGALQLHAAEVEERLQALDQTYGLVRLVHEAELPDRTLNLHYSFVHGLYQQSLYADLPPSRRSALAAALGQTLEHHQGERSTAAAAQLACLYEVGRDFGRAARQFGFAALNDARVFAHREAVVLAQRGLRLLEHLPETPERDALELPLQTALGLQLQVTEGFAKPAAKQAYSRARELCARTSGSPGLFSIMWGLWLDSKVRSELARALELAEELRELAQQQGEPALMLQAQQALTVTSLCRGEPCAALRHMEYAATLYDPARHRAHSAQFGQDPGVACKAFGAVALWALGFPDEARLQCEEAVRLSHELSQPSSQALALHFASMLHQLCRDSHRARVCAEACGAIADEHGFSFWRAGAAVMSGWARANGGDFAAGVEQLHQGIHDWKETGSVTYQTYYLGLLAEALWRQGQIAAAGAVLDEALVLAERTGEGLYASELHRLRGEVFAVNREEVEQDFRRALEIARRQNARSFELRSAVSLARLLQRRGAPAEGHRLLAECYAGFKEGLNTPDLQDARLLLADLAS